MREPKVGDKVKVTMRDGSSYKDLWDGVYTIHSLDHYNYFPSAITVKHSKEGLGDIWPGEWEFVD